MPMIDAKRLKEMIELPAFLLLLGVTPHRKAKDTYRAKCPLKHHHDNEGFAIGPTGWTCHYCKKKGDFIRLWMEYTGEPFLSACYSLCRKLRIEPPHKPDQERGRGTVSRLSSS